MTNKTEIKFFEIVYNFIDNPFEQNQIGIVTDAEDFEEFSEELDAEIFFWGLNEERLQELVSLGENTDEDFIVFSFKPTEASLEIVASTNKISQEDVIKVAGSINKNLTPYQVAYILTHYHLYEIDSETWDLTIERMIYEIIAQEKPSE